MAAFRAGVLFGLSLLSASIAAVVPSFNYGSQKVRGVNLGGWLVLEPWITPSIFDNTNDPRIIDEWTFGQYQDHATALAVLQNHWNTWITESDFQAIAAAGLNHVRIPIGYWAFDVSMGEPFIQGQYPYLTQAVAWAQKYGIKVLIDLHGVPGSQNGFDNSGRKTSNPSWYKNQSNVDRSDAIMKQLASTFSGSTVVSAIEPLNENPSGTSQQSNTVVVLHDAFQPLSYWNGFMVPSKGYQGVMMDTHIYQMFSDAQVAMSNAQHIQAACAQGSSLSSFDLWIIVGEWSPAQTDCAKYLNGRGVGARYDGTYPGSSYVGSCTGLTGDVSTFSSDYKTFLRQYWEAQTSTYEQGQGWLQWAWKTEQAPEWSYSAGLANGWIPLDPTQRAYPNICN
ncbi:hypothetical protein H0H92_013117 [Tricholoma furcatifolium]|nr:hypothetical protein H0H92_013117 [Tricholoma furcatifolium]